MAKAVLVAGVVRKPVDISPARATDLVSQAMAGMWAASTTKNRRNLFRRFMRWTQQHNLGVSADTATMFAVAAGPSPQSRLAYAKALSGTFRALELPNEPLKTLCRALTAAGARNPKRQAIPAPKTQLIQWARSLPIRTAVAIGVAWKSASRWTETTRLTKKHFVKIAPDMIVVDWDDLPKGCRAGGHRTSRFAVLVGDGVPTLSTCLKKLFDEDPNAPLSNTTTAGLRRLFRKAPFPSLRRCTAHSIKVGAVAVLIKAVANRKLAGHIASRLAKHKVEGDRSTFAPTTGLYGRNRLHTALALRTQLATRLL